MKKPLFVLSWIVLVLSTCVLGLKIDDIIQDTTPKKNWKRTTAVIENINMPECEVYGTYTDYTTFIHKDDLLYVDKSYSKMDNDKIKSYYGTNVDILYNPYTNKIEKYYEPETLYLLFAVPLAGSLGYVIWFSNRKRKHRM